MYIVGDGIKLVPGVYTKCDGCPCLNNDYSEFRVDECNLGYDSECVELMPDAWVVISNNCGLDKVVYVTHENGIIKTEFVPHKIELIDPKEVKK